MLTEICQYLRNWFEKEVITGSFTVADGVLSFSDSRALPLIEGQYFRIAGSLLNDGVHRLGDENDELVDETFSGAIWSMAVPPDFVKLAEEIKSWCTDNANALNSPYQSESFGGYSYSKGYSGGTAQGVTWQGQFAARLAPWRKI